MAVYRWSFAKCMGGAAGGLALACCSAVLFVGLAAWSERVTGWWWLLWGLAVYWGSPLALLGFLAGFVLLLEAIQDLFLTVEVHPFGLVWRRLHKRTVLPWHAIQSVWNTGTHAHHGGKDDPYPFLHYALVLQDGRRFLFGAHLHAFRQLGRTIEEEMTRRLLPQAVEAYRSGETLDFGRLQVSTAGWTKGGRLLPWEEVVRVYVDHDGWFTIERREKPWPQWYGCTLSKLSNVQLLLRLVDEVWQGPSGARGEPGDLPRTG